MRLFKWLFKERKLTPQIQSKNCMHLIWEPESKANGWRETCVNCGLKAQGSCQ